MYNINMKIFKNIIKFLLIPLVLGGVFVSPNFADAQYYIYGSLSISCRPNTYAAQTNTAVGWSASGVGGNGIYTYSWSGSDGISGNSNSILHTYTTEGSKYASITVRSGDGQTATANCGSIYVYSLPNTNYPTLGGSCNSNVSNAYVGSSINWSAYAYGGNGVYTYSWSDSDGHSSFGQYFSRYYTSGGMKYMNLTITSGGQSVTRNCSVYIMPNVINNVSPSYPIQNQVLAYTDTNPDLTAVYLSDVPYTGLEDIFKSILFISILLIWSGLLSYMFLKRNKIQEVYIKSEETSKKQDSFVSEDEAGLNQISEYAKMYKIILSSDALVKIFKLAKTRKINASEIIRQVSKGDWVSIGEKDLEKYL